MTSPDASPVAPHHASPGMDLGKAGRLIVQVFAWVWFFMAGVGGLILLIHEGPLPITNGWFAMFSGIAWCPGTAWVLKKYANIRVSMLAQFLTALIIMFFGPSRRCRHPPPPLPASSLRCPRVLWECGFYF